MTVQDLLAKYPPGQKYSIDGADAGQCTAIPHAWEQMLGLPLLLGNAKDTPASAYQYPNDYGVVAYTTGYVPQPGWIAVWDANWGEGNGHTGVVVSSNPATMQVYEQNDGDGGVAHVGQHNYQDVIYFIIPKALTQGGDQVTPEQLEDLKNHIINVENILAGGQGPLPSNVIAMLQDLKGHVLNVESAVEPQDGGEEPQPQPDLATPMPGGLAQQTVSIPVGAATPSSPGPQVDSLSAAPVTTPNGNALTDEVKQFIADEVENLVTSGGAQKFYVAIAGALVQVLTYVPHWASPLTASVVAGLTALGVFAVRNK